VCQGSCCPDVEVSNVDNTDNQIQVNIYVTQVFIKQTWQKQQTGQTDVNKQENPQSCRKYKTFFQIK
jgi:hypothetical protein